MLTVSLGEGTEKSQQVNCQDENKGFVLPRDSKGPYVCSCYWVCLHLSPFMLEAFNMEAMCSTPEVHPSPSSSLVFLHHD